MSDDLVKMARLAQRDDRMATGALYGDLADRIEALTEQLEAARADAKEAEGYAEGLERDLKTCCMAQTVMDNTVAELERERDDYAFKLADANNTYSEMHVALIEANDKLEKAVEALRFYADENRYGLPSDGPWGLGSTDFGKIARATLAKIGGEKG